ncbi:MAG: CDP-alcohol phosphatidyltransferase family protein [Tannerella sp.]|jgi:hypothetical protein|nr:CDP-alcohol phosphatidyltransferase family protein [Tannerella sp.]
MDTEYEKSLKSLETENYWDRNYFRPLGFRIAKALRNTGITPNAVTIISIFIGAAAGPLFYPENLALNALGVALLFIANILDCVDGQLARLTGIKSEIGRILDGLAGDIWFALIYTFLALRLNRQFDTNLFFIPAVLSALSHLLQANITDYYKTVHLFFINREKGAEFQNCAEVRRKYAAMKPGIGKVLFYFYLWYTTLQETVTPKLQKLLQTLKEKYGDDIPEDLRLSFRRSSSRLMKHCIDMMTFNWRSLVLYLSVLTGYVWFDFFFEIIILNIILCISIFKHEKICKKL